MHAVVEVKLCKKFVRVRNQLTSSQVAIGNTEEKHYKADTEGRRCRTQFTLAVRLFHATSKLKHDELTEGSVFAACEKCQ